MVIVLEVCLFVCFFTVSFSRTGRKNEFTECQRLSQTRDRDHLCTPLTRDQFLPFPAVSGESSGDNSRFCHAFNPYL